MIKHFFRWLYHRRQRKAAKNRLLGRRKLMPKFRRFSYHAFERATFGKYDAGGIGKLKAAVIYIPLACFMIWVTVESLRALNIFQP